MTRRRHVDKYALCDRAKAAAERRIREAGFGDLISHTGELYVITYTNDELREMKMPTGEWVGQYVAGSLEGAPQGLTIAINIDEHANIDEMIETMLHEAGHALWETVTEEGQAEYRTEADALSGYQWGAEEAFADDTMYRCLGLRQLMRCAECFEAITQIVQ